MFTSKGSYLSPVDITLSGNQIALSVFQVFFCSVPISLYVYTKRTRTYIRSARRRVAQWSTDRVTRRRSGIDTHL